jgi:hypothetical protein
VPYNLEYPTKGDNKLADEDFYAGYHGNDRDNCLASECVWRGEQCFVGNYGD